MNGRTPSVILWTRMFGSPYSGIEIFQFRRHISCVKRRKLKNSLPNYITVVEIRPNLFPNTFRREFLSFGIFIASHIDLLLLRC